MWASGKAGGAAVGFDSRSRAYLAPNVAMAGSTWVKQVPYSVDYDNLSEWNTVDDYRWDCAEDGFYRIVAVIGIKYLGINLGPLAAIYKNGAIQYIQTGAQVSTGVNETFAMVATSLQLSAGDYIEIYGYHKGASPLNSVAGGFCTIERFA